MKGMNSMKIKDNYVLQKIVDEYLVVPVAEEADRLHGVIKLTETGAFIWDYLLKGIKCIDELEKPFMLKYKIDKTTAHKDIEDFISQLYSIGCLED